ncbi:hypothetical protein L1887_45387 [Cichorium endivia]|nr:hypothetical protein L1887_45387 [Cichorium endivia]
MRITLPLRIWRRMLFWMPNRHKGQPLGERLRLALQELGPVWIKFGQMLSTRRDLFPPLIADELAMLQDRVAPFDGARAKKQIEEAMGNVPVETWFDDFDIKPLASASIAQVHTARLKENGKEVVIKVIRPDILPVIKADMKLIYRLARWVPRLLPDGRRLRPLEVVREYEKTLIDELNLLRESANAIQLRRNFENSPMLYVPEVYSDYCSQNMMVMERIYGIPVSDVVALEKQGTNMKLLAERGVQVAELHVDSGWVPPDTNVEEFEFAIRTVCEPIFEKPLAEISFGHVLLNLFNTARRFNMEVQPQLVLLQKTLLYVEGVGRQLYPQLDLWKTAKPFLESWIKDQVGIPALVRSLKEKGPFWIEKMPEIPELVYDSLRQSKNLQHSMDKIARELQSSRVRQGQSRYLFGIGATLLLSGTLLLINRPDWQMMPAWLMAGGGGSLASRLAKNALSVLIIAVIVVLLFGTKKLGSIGSDLGASIKGFKKAMSDDESKQDKTSQDADFTAKSIADKQEEAKKEDAKRHDKEQRLPVAVKTVAGWVRALRSLASTVQNELAQELKLQEFQESLKKVEKASMDNLTPELKASMDELREAAESMKRSYSVNDPEKASDEANTIHNPVVKGSEEQREGVTPASAEHQAAAPEQTPQETELKKQAQPEEPVAKAAEVKPAASVSESSPSSSDKA